MKVFSFDNDLEDIGCLYENVSIRIRPSFLKMSYGN